MVIMSAEKLYNKRAWSEGRGRPWYAMGERFLKIALVNTNFGCLHFLSELIASSMR